MRALVAGKNQAGQRLDKYLKKYFREAPSGFIYKMLRKKNIVLNDRRADGGEKLQEGDRILVYLSEETIEKFRGTPDTSCDRGSLPLLPVVYQDENVMLINKPAGMLSQKAEPGDISVVECLIRRLLDQGEVSREELETFRPSVCNRLDRNTSGLVLAGKTLQGLQELSLALKERTLEKYYLCLVKGSVSRPEHCSGYLRKEKRNNQVRISQKPAEGGSFIETAYTPLWNCGTETLLKVDLITGRSHQIRAHLASLGHPLAGDPKYGDPEWNRYLKNAYGLERQFLHAYEIRFLQCGGCLKPLENRSFTAPLPQDLLGVLQEKKCPLKLS